LQKRFSNPPLIIKVYLFLGKEKADFFYFFAIFGNNRPKIDFCKLCKVLAASTKLWWLLPNFGGAYQTLVEAEKFWWSLQKFCEACENFVESAKD